MAAELRAYTRAALMPPEDLAEQAGSVRLYALFDPELEAPEVAALGTEQGHVWLYSSVPLLVESCGDGQPYVVITPSQVVELAGAVDGTLLVVFDVWHPAGARYPEQEPWDFEPLEPIEPEGADDQSVWIPTLPVRSGDRHVSAELYGTRPGEKLLLVFDSVEQAQQACGQFQPLSAIHADDVDAVARECGADEVVTNGVLVQDARHSGPEHDWVRSDRDQYFGFG